MTQGKIDKSTRDKLFSTKADVIITAIQSLKENGNVKYLPILFELLMANPEMIVREEILKLLGTIKDKETIPVFAQALQNDKYVKIRKDLTTVCWQNGMDFSMYLSVFTELIINEKWDVAFEAFTLIENLEHFPPEEQLKPIKLRIANALKSADEQKQYFLEELLKMM